MTPIYSILTGHESTHLTGLSANPCKAARRTDLTPSWESSDLRETLERLTTHRPLTACRRCLVAAEVELATRPNRIYALTVQFRVTSGPFDGQTFTIPVLTGNRLMGAVRDGIAKDLDLDSSHVELIRIEIMGEPTSEGPTEIPLTSPTVTIAPGIYFRPLTRNGLASNYSIHWANLTGRGLVYSIQRVNPGGHNVFAAMEDATLAEAQTWLDEHGFQI